QKEFSTVKQAVSVAHQYDREGVLSELYGVTHWYHDFKGHKLQGDWQAALGVTIRVPHLSFLSMEGEAKRDWPASINYQSPWFREYPFIEDHFSRLNTALTRGQADINIGVIHPIESFWLFFGPNDQTGALREQYDQNYKNLISWLLYGLLDFDFISEALLPDLCPEAGTPLQVGAMNYETIIVPDCKTLRSSTVERLEKFQKQGGTIIFVGKIPTHIDVVPSERIKKLADNCQQIQFNRYELLEALDEERKVEVRKANGKLSTNLFHQLRDDNECKWLFLGHVNRRRNLVDRVNKYKIKIKGRYNPLVYDTLSGEIKPCPAKIVGSDTIIDHQLYAEDSLLLKLVPGVPEKKPEPEKVRFKTSLKKSKKLSDPVDFSLSEPNVLLLDQAEYAFNDGQFQKKKEVLKIDNEFRDRLGIPRRRDHIRQPYTYDQDYRAVEDKLSLRYMISSKIKPSKVELALENPHKTTISLNGQQVESEVNCFFTDKAIKTISLPELKKGRNELILEIPFGRQTNVEWCYLLGNFGVEVKGSYKYIIEPTRKLAFGDWVVQGLPFYAGNVTYRCPLELEENISEAVLEIPHFSAPVIKVCLDGKRRGLIAFAPHRLNLGELLAGQHLLEITVYGDRYNAFGTLHNANDEFKWYGPDSYRTTGSEWTDTYLLRKMGVLSRPVIYKK
ncbi:MAG: hypothetical protein ACOC2O_03235, partial [Bacillota bacterium]